MTQENFDNFMKTKVGGEEIPQLASGTVPITSPMTEVFVNGDFHYLKSGEKKTIQSKTIEASETGVLVGSTFEEQFRLARVYHASKLMPATLDSPEKILVALQICHELGLPPMTSIKNICVINQTPMLFGDLPLALVQKSGMMENINEQLSEDKAVCTVKRKGQSPVTREFSMEDAKRAKLTGKGPWMTYPKRMLQCRARAWALKDTFPDVLGGVGIMEYDDYEPAENEGANNGNKNKAEELNQKFKNQEIKEVQVQEVK